MSVTSNTNKSTAAGNGVATVFPFSFVILENTDLEVYLQDASGNVTQLTEGVGSSNYSLSVASYPGSGTITYPATGTPALATGNTLTMLRVIDITQEVRLNNQGGYFPEIQEGAFDKLTMIAQQLQEAVDRAVKVEIGSTLDPDALVQQIADDAQTAADAAALVAGVGLVQATETQIGIQEVATQAETDAGVTDLPSVTPLKFKTGIDNRLASQAEAIAGSNNTKLMTPLRVSQAVTALSPNPTGSVLYLWANLI